MITNATKCSKMLKNEKVTNATNVLIYIQTVENEHSATNAPNVRKPSICVQMVIFSFFY